MSDRDVLRPAAVPASLPKLRLRLLGRMEAFDHTGSNILPRVRKTRAVLAVLALAYGQPVLRENLTRLLWSTRDREQGRGSLRQSVHELHDVFNQPGTDLLIADRNHLVLRADDIDIDVRTVSRATSMRPEALEMLGAGPLLEDLVGLDPAFDRWLESERRKLSAGAAAVAEAVLAAYTATSAVPELVLAAAERLVAIDPLREVGWRAAMTAYVAMDQRVGAMEAFERCHAALAEHANLQPSDETRRLYDSIRVERAAAKSAPLPSAQKTPLHGVRLGVMPFRFSGTGDGDGLSVGLADEITTALSRFRGIYLIASPSLAAIRDGTGTGNLDLLKLDFLLEGTVQRAGNRIRVSMRLLELQVGYAETGTGEVVWARRFERADADLFSLQDEVAAETVAQVDPELLLRAANRATARAPADATAYELMLQAIPALYRIEHSGFRAAGKLLEAAIARDPDYGPAYAWLAYWHIFLVGQGWSGDDAASMKQADQLAMRAITLDPADARALTIAGHVRAYFDHRLADAIALHERALGVNPYLPLAWALSGTAHAYAGHHDEAIRRIEEARRLSPFDPHGYIFEAALMLPKFMLGAFDAVVELGRRAVQLNPTLSSSYKCYLAALGHLGPSSEMLALRARLLELEPGFCVRRALDRPPIALEADRMRYAEGLRRAGLPEDAETPHHLGFTPAAKIGPATLNQ